MGEERNAYMEDRLKLVSINKLNIAECILGKMEIVGLPDDCKIYDVYYNNRTLCFELLVSSMEFEPMVEGAELERINGVCKLIGV